MIEDSYQFIKETLLRAAYKVSNPIFSTGGIGIASDEDAQAFLPGIQKHPDFDDPTRAGFRTWTGTFPFMISGKTCSVAFKFIQKFFWKPLFRGTGGSGNLLNDSELQALLPYVDVTVEQMKEAQRRAPRSCLVLASSGAFATEAEANAQGFIMPAAFIDGGVEKNGFFISPSVTSVDANTIYIGEVYDGSVGHELFRLSTSYPSVQATFVNAINNTMVNFFEGNAKDAITVGVTLGSFKGTTRGNNYANGNIQCESAYTVAALSLLSLACAQYATSTDDCAWYDPNGVTNFPKGINNNNRDINDASVTIPTVMSGTAGSAFPVDKTAYCKTTHNGKIYGITHVNGWLWRPFVGYGYVGGRYQLFDNSKYKIGQITPKNCDTDTSMYQAITTNIGNAWSEASDTPLFVDQSGQGRQLNCLFSHSSGTASNLFGLDYHYRGSRSAGFVSGGWNHSSLAGIFERDYNNWTHSHDDWGFRVVGYA